MGEFDPRKNMEKSKSEAIQGWPGLLFGLIPIVWMIVTSKRFGFVEGTGSAIVDFFPAVIAIMLFGFGLLGGRTKAGKAIMVSVWIFLAYSAISEGCQRMSRYGGEGDCTRTSPQFC